MHGTSSFQNTERKQICWSWSCACFAFAPWQRCTLEFKIRHHHTWVRCMLKLAEVQFTPNAFCAVSLCRASHETTQFPLTLLQGRVQSATHLVPPAAAGQSGRCWPRGPARPGPSRPGHDPSPRGPPRQNASVPSNMKPR